MCCLPVRENADNVTTTYTYYIDGLRKSKKVGTGETKYFIWSNGNMVYEFTATDDTTYFFGLHLVSSDDYKYVLNAHGDVVALVNASGTVTKRYEYDAFGVELNPDENDTNPYRYCAEYFDIESGTIYLRARYYTPNHGRFTQLDPARDGLNWYAYCYNNPVKYIDPSGRIVTDWDAENLTDEGIREIARLTILYEEAKANDDRTGMDLAHKRAEEIRATQKKNQNDSGNLAVCVIFMPLMLSGCTPSDRNYWLESNIVWKSSAIVERLGPQSIVFDSTKLGHKYGKHRSEYAGMSYADYQSYAIDVFNNPSMIIYDYEQDEFYYIKGDDLLRLKPDGSFVSLYPGANSERVRKAR